MVARVRFLRHVPRLLLIPAERMVIAWRGQGLFDHAFYLAQNADVADAGHEPFAHYLRHGWREAIRDLMLHPAHMRALAEGAQALARSLNDPGPQRALWRDLLGIAATREERRDLALA